MPEEQVEYAGFWIRVAAALIDTVLLLCITLPLLIAIYGRTYWDSERTGFVAGAADLLISYVAPAIAVIVFWIYKQATPGKMAVAVRVVDARTGNAMTAVQSVTRYLGYYVALLPLGLGILWVAFDPKKQGWHDKLAGTVVVKSKHRVTVPIRSDNQ